MLRWKVVLYVLGFVFMIMGTAMLFPLLFALWYEDASFLPLLFSSTFALVVGGGLVLIFKGIDRESLSVKESMATVSLAWIGAGMIGALPFFFSSSLPSFTDCFFETISGLTTTGASVLSNIEALPRGLLMWRSLTHWLGGMGIILLSLIILPLLGVGGMQLYRAEVPGPLPDKLSPRLKDTALILWKVYLLLTLAEIFLLRIGGMSLFDSIAHTFGTMATGGFSTKNLSIGHYSSTYIHVVITVFMFLAGANFTLHFKGLQGDFRSYFRDIEFRYYVGITLAMIGIVTWNLWGEVYKGLGDALKYASFQVVSILTTTGYATADFEKWRPLSKAILLIAMFIGGCAGSTGGGIKVVRMVVMWRHIRGEVKKVLHPRAVFSVKLGKTKLSSDVMGSIWSFFFLYLIIVVMSFVILTSLGVDMETSLYASVACMGNIGPGFAGVGPMDNYAHLPGMAKWVLSFCMILGRLEIYTLLVLFSRNFWEK